MGLSQQSKITAAYPRNGSESPDPALTIRKKESFKPSVISSKEKLKQKKKCHCVKPGRRNEVIKRGG